MSNFLETPEKQALVIKIDGRYFSKFGKKGQTQTAWSLAGAEVFLNSLTPVLHKLDEKGKKYSVERVEIVDCLECYTAKDVFKLRYRLERMAANSQFYDLTLCFRKAKRNLVEETALTAMQMMKAERSILKRTAMKIDKYISCLEYELLPSDCLKVRLYNYKKRKAGVAVSSSEGV
ncbi:hypothetical protein KI743_06485 [Vibrio sp. D420a]|uniref:hypothetical protein n=1 Tax=Vibrio sp. D420a TaxID=2836895 RepID=UPI002554A84E|nr:hypothetical protein [Vibrio sp. D420a]MDK9761641.1 hypothetical protein [Vibrio sp. D420a]